MLCCSSLLLWLCVAGVQASSWEAGHAVQRAALMQGLALCEWYLLASVAILAGWKARALRHLISGVLQVLTEASLEPFPACNINLPGLQMIH